MSELSSLLQNVGQALVEFGQGVIRFFQFSIPIAMGTGSRSTVADVSADVVENLGKLDPRSACLGVRIHFWKWLTT